MVPTSRLFQLVLAAIPIAALPLVVPASFVVLLLLWLSVAFAIVFDIAVLRSAQLEAALEVPSSAGVGAGASVGAFVRSRSRKTLRSELRAELSAPLVRGGDLHAAISTGTSEHALEIETPRRGRGRIEALWMRTRGPLGLVERIDRFAEGADEIAVVPDAERVRRLAIEHLGAQEMRGGLRRERFAGEGGEFESLQSYVLGMDPRAIDWKASARHQSLRVMRYRLERRQRIVLSIDTGALMADPIDGLERLDHAVHSALLLARAALVAGDLVGLHAYGAEPRAHVPPKSGTPQLTRLRVAMAGLRSEDAETNHVLGIRDLFDRLTRRSLLVVFTEFVDSTTAELMLEHIAHLAKKHLVIFVALDDPVLEEPLATLPREPADLSSAVVATAIADRRRLVLARLRSVGVQVIHAPPGRAAGELLDRYLRIKRRGQLG